jgi:hypothetical protein
MKIKTLYSAILCPRCKKPILPDESICQTCLRIGTYNIGEPNISLSGRSGGPFADKLSPTTTRHSEMGEQSRPTTTFSSS